MAPHASLLVAQRAWLKRFGHALRVGGWQSSIGFWQACKKVLMNVPHGLRRPDALAVPLRPEFFEALLGRHVGKRQSLPAGLVCVLGAVVAQRLLDLQGRRVLPFNAVRVIRVHGPQQMTQSRMCAWGTQSREAIRLTDQVVRLLQQRGQPMLTREKRLHVHRIGREGEVLRLL